MSDQAVPILTKAPEEKTDEVTEALTELTKSTEFLGRTLDITQPLKKMTEAGTKSMKLMQETFLGDISFVTGPLKEVGGIFKTMGTGIGSIFGKKKKVPPKRSQMLKTNPESVYITDTLLKADKDENFLEKFKGLLPMLLGGGAAAALAKLGPLLMKTGAIGMIIGSLVWMAIDGFKAYAKAGEWGVSKISAVIGGVLGGTGSGWKNAFKQMGKWALMGAGIGLLVGGPVGALVGGLIGAAIGGILGFIGGEKIAKAIDAMAAWSTKAWKKITEFSKDLLGSIVNFFSGVFQTVKNFFLNLFIDQVKPDGKVKKALVKQYWDIIKNVFIQIGTKVKNLFLGMVTGIVNIGTDIKDGIVRGVQAIPDLLIGAIDGAFNLLSGLWDNLSNALLEIPIVGDIFGFLDKWIFEPIGNIFLSIKDGIVDFIKDPIGWGRDLIKTLMDSVSEIFANIKEGFLTWITGGDEDVPASESFNPYRRAGKVDDGIIKPDGTIIQTSPQDTIIATKNPIAFADKESSSMIQNINSSGENSNENLENLIRELINKQMPVQNNNTMMQNITSRYNPQAIMANLTTEVF